MSTKPDYRILKAQIIICVCVCVCVLHHFAKSIK